MQRETVRSLRRRGNSSNRGLVRGKAETPGSVLAGRLRSRTGACYVFGLFGWMDGVTCACHRRPSAEREGARAASAARAAIAADLYQDKRMSRSQTGVSEGFIGLILSGLM